MQKCQSDCEAECNRLAPKSGDYCNYSCGNFCASQEGTQETRGGGSNPSTTSSGGATPVASDGQGSNGADPITREAKSVSTFAGDLLNINKLMQAGAAGR